MMETVKELGPELGIVVTCAALGVARATYYRRLQPRIQGPLPKKRSPREVSAEEKAAVLAVLHEERFIDLAPSEVYETSSTRADTSAASEPCTASWRRRAARCATAETSSASPWPQLGTAAARPVLRVLL